MRNTTALRRLLLSTRALSILPNSPLSNFYSTAKIDEESISDYDPARYYPVQLNETLCGSYKTRVKLGFGRTSTTWLCTDDQYVMPIIRSTVQCVSVY
jgi:hypothetical protein